MWIHTTRPYLDHCAHKTYVFAAIVLLMSGQHIHTSLWRHLRENRVWTWKTSCSLKEWTSKTVWRYSDSIMSYQQLATLIVVSISLMLSLNYFITPFLWFGLTPGLLQCYSLIPCPTSFWPQRLCSGGWPERHLCVENGPTFNAFDDQLC